MGLYVKRVFSLGVAGLRLLLKAKNLLIEWFLVKSLAIKCDSIWICCTKSKLNHFMKWQFTMLTCYGLHLFIYIFWEPNTILWHMTRKMPETLKFMKYLIDFASYSAVASRKQRRKHLRLNQNKQTNFKRLSEKKIVVNIIDCWTRYSPRKLAKIETCEKCQSLQIRQ